ncbi:MAG TPA: hypothetical protein EYP61_01045 [Candidatus Latescibacteria bacterium]|nr:hypothetical protein [Candidatus Latescibacterota bacterium]
MGYILLEKDEIARLRRRRMEGRAGLIYRRLMKLADETAAQEPPIYRGNDPINRRALGWYFGRLGAMALVGVLEEDLEKVEAARRLLRAIYRIAEGSRTPLNASSGRLSVEPIQEGNILPELIFVEHLLGQSGLLGEGERGMLEQVYRWMFPFFLLGFTEIQLSVDPGNNHTLLDASSAGLLAARLGERLPLWRRWVEFCNEQVLLYAEFAILEDGSQLECSPSYHTLVVARLLLHALLMRDMMGIELSDGLVWKAAAGVDWVLEVLTPDGHLPALNDSGREFDPSFLFSSASVLTQDGRYTSALDSFLQREEFGFEKSTLPFGFVLASGCDLPGSSPLPEVPDAFLLPGAGFAVLREELGGYLICKSDPRHLCHTHDERCSFEWWPFGRPGALDPGKVDYQMLKHFSYFRMPNAHNTVARYRPHRRDMRPQDGFFPDVEVSHDPHPPEPGGIELVKDGVKMWAKISEKVQLRRTVLVEGNLGRLRVIDELRGRDELPYDWCFHGRGRMELSGRSFSFTSPELRVEGEVVSPSEFQLVALSGPTGPYVAVRVRGSPERIEVVLSSSPQGGSG